MFRTFSSFNACAILVLAMTSRSLGQRDFSKVEIKATHVAGPVYMLEGSGGNIGVSAGDDGVLIIDDQFAPLAEKIKAALKEINPGKLKFVINTHWHGDHTGGNAEFGAEAPIIAHENVRARVSTVQMLLGRERQPLPPEGWPVITFEESVSVHFNGEEIELRHFPHGHTDGDSVVFFTKSNVVHMGDHLFTGRFPFVDIDHGGDVEGMARNIAKLIEELPADVKVIPGHGPLSTMADVKAFHGMLVETTAIVRDAKTAGKSLEEIKEAGLPDKWKGWGEGFISTDQWISIIYASLAKAG